MLKRRKSYPGHISLDDTGYRTVEEMIAAAGQQQKIVWDGGETGYERSCYILLYVYAYMFSCWPLRGTLTLNVT